MHNRTEYNFAYNEGGLLKFVWKNMFQNTAAQSQNQSTMGSMGGGGGGQQYNAQQYQNQNTNRINQFHQQNQTFDLHQQQPRGKG